MRINQDLKLSPEQKKAIEVFQSAIAQQDSLIVPKIAEEHVSVTGSRIFVVGKIGRKSLPHDHHWVWNQSKAQQTIENSSTHEIVMYKLNPRKKNKNQTQGYPSYKLWVFVMKSKFGEPKSNTNFIWCERGRQEEEKEIKIENKQSLQLIMMENKSLPLPVIQTPQCLPKISELNEEFWKDLVSVKGEYLDPQEYDVPFIDMNVFAF